MQFELKRFTDSTMKMEGVQTGPMKFVQEHNGEKLVVVHKKGRKYWSGTGMQWHYAPTEFAIFKYTKKVETKFGTTTYTVDSPIGLIHFPVRS